MRTIGGSDQVQWEFFGVGVVVVNGRCCRCRGDLSNDGGVPASHLHDGGIPVQGTNRSKDGLQ